MSLFARFFLILIAFSMLPLLGGGAWLLSTNEAARENAHKLHEQLAQVTADAVESAAADLNRALSFVVELGRDSKEGDLLILQRAAAAHPSLALLSLLDASGMEKIRLSDKEMYEQRFEDRSNEPLVQEARKAGRAVVGPVVVVAGRPVLTVVHPLVDGRMLYAGYSLRRLWQRLDKIQVGSTGRMVLLDAAGRPLPKLAEDFPEPGWRGLPTLAGESGWVEDVQTKRGPMAGAHRLVPSLGWRALSLQSRREALAKPEGFALKAVALAGLIFIIVAFAAVWISNQLARPLAQLAAAAGRAADRNLDTQVPALGWGELNQLSDAFNTMLGKLREYDKVQIDRLLSEKAKVDGLVRNIPDGILLAGFDGSVLYVNPTARGLLGLPEQDEAGPPRRLHDLLGKQATLKDLAAKLVRKYARQGEAEAQFDSRFFICRAAVIGADGKDTGVLMILRDVTHQKELDRMKEDFFHSIVHDLRAPLSTVDGYANIMFRNKSLGEKERGYLGFMIDSTKKLRGLVKDILDTAKLESGTMELAVVDTTVQDLLKATENTFGVQAQEAKISLVVEPGAGPHDLRCDKGLVERVLQNLTGNAMKFAAKEGKGVVTIGGRSCEDGTLEFWVQDNGNGMPKEKTGDLFQKFKQLGDGVKAGGYGLGLSICRQIVEAHGGRIWVESDTGKGAKFIFRIPRAPAGVAKVAA